MIGVINKTGMTKEAMFIALPHGGSGTRFPVARSGRDYIIQGQKACSLADHPKSHSLGVWLRQGYTDRKDTNQAIN